MASLTYGHISGDIEVRELPVAASQYFYQNGVNAVYLDGSGHVTLALTATATLYGFAIPPKGRGAGTSDNYWLSSSTAGEDTIAVVVNPSANARFLLPADDTVTQAMVGNACDLIAVNDGTATTVDVGTSSTDVFRIIGIGTDYGGSTTDVVVVINQSKLQADT